MSASLPPLVLTFDVDDKGTVKYSRINKGLNNTNRTMDQSTTRMSRLSRSIGTMNQRWRGFTRGLFSAGNAFRAFAGILAGGLIVRQLTNVADQLDEIGKRSVALGLTTEALSELSFAANLAGISTEKFEKDLSRLPKFLSDADRGLSTASNALDKLGLSVDDLRGLSLDRQLELFADGFQDLQDPIERVNVLTAAFGRDGMNMVNMLADGSGGLREMRGEAISFGASVDSELTIKAAEFNDSMLRVKSTFSGLRREALAQFLLPASVELNLMATRIASLQGYSDGFGELLGIAHDTIAGMPDQFFIMLKQLEGIGISIDENFLNPFQSAYGSIIERNNTFFALLTGHLRFAKQEISALVPGDPEERSWSRFFMGLRASIEETTGLGELRRNIFGLSEDDITGSLRVLQPVVEEQKTLLELVEEEKERHRENGKQIQYNAEISSDANKERLESLTEELRIMNNLADAAQEERASRRADFEEEITGRASINEERLRELEAARATLGAEEEIVDITGKRVRTLEDVNRELDESAAAMSRLLDQQRSSDLYGGLRNVGGPLSGGMGELGSTLSGMESRARLVAEMEMQAEIQSLRAQELESLGAHHSEIEAAEQQHADTLNAISASRHRAQMTMLAGVISSTSATLSDYRRATENDSEALAITQKALAIGQATVNTYLAATAAMASSAVLGPVAAAAAAKAIVGLGLANVALIAATPIQKYHDGGIVTGRGGMDGLGPREVPAILEVGERVISREDVRKGSGSPQPVMIGILPENQIQNYFDGPRGRSYMRGFLSDMGVQTA